MSVGSDLSKRKALQYTEAQKQNFVNMAEKVGVPKAIDALGYPGSMNTGYLWCDAYGIELPASPLTQAARTNRAWYGVEEKRMVAQALLDAAYTQLSMVRGTGQYDENGDEIYAPITPKELSLLAGVVQKSIQTLALIDGQATTIIKSLEESTAPELLVMIQEVRAQNDTALRELRALPAPDETL